MIMTREDFSIFIERFPKHFTQKSEAKETIEYINSIYNHGSLIEKIYLYINNLMHSPKCQCGCNFKFSNRLSLGYGECSDKKCTYRQSRIREKIQKTTTETYGVECSFQSEKVKDKIKSTNISRYGVEYVSQSDAIKRKIKETSIGRYGVASPAKAAIVKEKAAATNNERYGGNAPTSSKTIREKVKSTNRERYGVDYVSQTDEARKKTVETNKKRYGVDHALQTDESKEKQRLTNLSRYGVEFYTQTEEYKEKALFTRTSTYYETNADLLPFIPLDLTKQTSKHSMVIWKCCGNISEMGGNNGPMSACCPDCFPKNNGRSSTEDELADFIKSIYLGEVLISDRVAIKPKELDIFLPEKKIAFEFNGMYWHSAKSKDDSDAKGKHFTKTSLCKDSGIGLMHVNEIDWIDTTKKPIIKSMIMHKFGLSKRIYARETKIVELSSKESNRFLIHNHLQGSCQSSIRIGLEFDGEIVAVMTFGKPRFNKIADWELIRYANKCDLAVVGGASKLLSYFRKLNTGSIISYANIDHSDGSLYRTIGFTEIGRSDPNYIWVKNSGKRIKSYSRYQTQKHKLGNILGDKFDPSLSESDNMFMNGYRKFYNCGNYVFFIE